VIGSNPITSLDSVTYHYMEIGDVRGQTADILRINLFFTFRMYFWRCWPILGDQRV